VRQWIEAIIDTLKDQFGLERHGAHTIGGVDPGAQGIQPTAQARTP
jgi:hypothetical protein